MAKFRSRLDRQAVRLAGFESSVVQPQFADACDINKIVARAVRGDLSALRMRVGFNGDITKQPDSLHEALQRGVEVNNMYDSLPASVRSKYPTLEEFTSALNDEANRAFFEANGVVVPKELPTPVKVEVVNPEPVTSEEAKS